MRSRPPRYVVLNPVRAGLCADPADWPWSSYRATAGLIRTPAWLETDWTLGQFGSDRMTAQERYRRFVDAGVERTPRAHGDLYLGTRGFARALAPGRSIPEIPRRHTSPIRRPLREILAPSATDRAIAEAYADGYTLAEIGTEIGRHYTTVSRRLRAYERSLATRRAA